MNAYIALFLSIFIWGVAFLAIRTSLKELSPLELTALRHVPLMVPALLFVSTRLLREALALVKDYPFKLPFVSFLLIPLYSVMLYKGMEGVTPALASLIIGASPLLAYFFAVTFRQEVFQFKKILGIACAFLGLGIALILGLGLEFKFETLSYVFLVFSASAASALYSVLAKEILTRHQPKTLMPLMILVGSFPLLLAFGGVFRDKLAVITPVAWASVAFLSLASSGFAFYTWFYALKKLPASNVVIFVNFIPFVTMGVGYFFFGETINVWMILGAVLVALGVYQTTR